MKSPNKRIGKLEPKFVGRFEVISKDNDIYEAKEISSKKLFTRHVDSLKKYNMNITNDSRIGIILKVISILLYLSVPIYSDILFESQPPIVCQESKKYVSSG